MVLVHNSILLDPKRCYSEYTPRSVDVPLIEVSLPCLSSDLSQRMFDSAIKAELSISPQITKRTQSLPHDNQKICRCGHK